MASVVYFPDNGSAFAANAISGPSYASALECDAVERHCVDLPRGTVIQTNGGPSTVLADLDFETYSEAGFTFDERLDKWVPWEGSPKGKRGLPVVGAPVYAAHPSTEVLSLAYNLKDGVGKRLWLPVMPPPADLLDFVRSGGLLEAWNSAFEFWIWHYVCHYRLGWPALSLYQTRDAAAKARAWSLPGKLALAGPAIGLKEEDAKKKEGMRLINKFSKPRQPSKRKRERRNHPHDHPEDAQKFYEYNEQDIVAEASISAVVPDMDNRELSYWLMDQSINVRGVHIDRKGLEDCVAVVRQAFNRYETELQRITNGEISTANELKKITEWLARNGLHVDDLTEESVSEELARYDQVDKARAAGVPVPPHLSTYEVTPQCRRVLEIRAILGASSIKKLYSIRLRLSDDDRLRDLFVHHGAHTGRPTGAGPQPLNMPSSGPPVRQCDDANGCGKHYDAKLDDCPWCGTPGWASRKVEWGINALEDALEAIASQDLDTVERIFGNAVAAVSGCLRGLFCAAPGKEHICSDYSAIEGVVTAAIAGEEWRMEVFRTHRMIYEASAAQITGVPFEEFVRHKKETGEHHPLRKKIGKFAELASGFGGWIGAWKQFGADEYLSDAEIKDAIIKWREASPAIVELWGGQVRKTPGRWEFRREMFGLEGMAIMAVLNPGCEYSTHGVTYFMRGDVLYCRLMSGRCLTYHQPRVVQKPDRFSGETIWSLSYMGYNRDSSRGPIGWLRIDTYGGRLCENVVQATARDIMFYALYNLEERGYPVVLHVYDEAVAEIPADFGSIEEFEAIMADLPDWCRDWPITAAGGWRGKRYRKD